MRTWTSDCVIDARCGRTQRDEAAEQFLRVNLHPRGTCLPLGIGGRYRRTVRRPRAGLSTGPNKPRTGKIAPSRRSDCALRAGAVNARRPRSGRSAATSIDSAEHGDILHRVMAPHKNLLHPTSHQTARSNIAGLPSAFDNQIVRIAVGA
jgi:hypothetical protein